MTLRDHRLNPKQRKFILKPAETSAGVFMAKHMFNSTPSRIYKGPLGPLPSGHKQDDPFGCFNCKANLLLTVNKLLLYTGSRTNIERFHAQTSDIKLAIDLVGETNYVAEYPAISANAGARKLLGKDICTPPVPATPVLTIEWPDASVPELTDPKWWQRLATRLKQVNGIVTINCMGGHGRTGTCVAILAHYLGAVPAEEDVVTWVRKAGCPEMVESHEQLEYITAMTGLVTDALPSLGNYGVAHGVKAGTGTLASGGATDKWTKKWFPVPEDGLQGVYETEYDRRLLEEDDQMFDPAVPPPNLDNVAMDRLTDQSSMDFMWDDFLAGASLCIHDSRLCKWLARKFYYQHPKGDILEGHYDVGGQSWSLTKAKSDF